MLFWSTWELWCLEAEESIAIWSGIEMESQLNWTHATEYEARDLTEPIFPASNIQVARFVTSAPFNKAKGFISTYFWNDW